MHDSHKQKPTNNKINNNKMDMDIDFFQIVNSI